MQVHTYDYQKKVLKKQGEKSALERKVNKKYYKLH